jgi:hypothetical protein
VNQIRYAYLTVLFYGLIKELLVEITELEKQRDDLEAQLKKVPFAL